jgi:hypothetical protein
MIFIWAIRLPLQPVVLQAEYYPSEKSSPRFTAGILLILTIDKKKSKS